MATKKITDLQLRSSFDDTCNVPVDDSSQTWRATGAQMLAYIKAQIQSELVPSGSVLPYAGTAAPTGFLMCDGSQVSRTTYAALFAAIGTAHGNGNGTTTFHLPDYRGRFLRGKDGGAALDPDRATRTAMATGGATGDNVGSVQADALQGHWHDTYWNNTSTAGVGSGAPTTPPGSGTISAGARTLITDGTNGTPRTAAESRPKNANVAYIIKT